MPFGSWQTTAACVALVSVAYVLLALTVRLMAAPGQPEQAGDPDQVPINWAVRQWPSMVPPVTSPKPKRIVERVFDAIAAEQRAKLEEGARPGAQQPSEGVFAAVGIAMPLSVPLLQHNLDWNSGGQGNKNIVGARFLPKIGRCVVYGIGIADESSFEQEMARVGCETHAFDCTLTEDAASVAGKAFTFHPWCIGRNTEQTRDDVSHTNYGKKQPKASFAFKSLEETMRSLGHTRVDLLKFDIEGFEWELFQHQILGNPNPPDQLSFELHTDKANPAYVPHHNVEGKGYKEVNELFLQLFDLGYRVVSKEVNSGDHACAEFVMVRA